MGYILSCATTPARIDKLIFILSETKLDFKYFVINICSVYRRFGRFKIPKSLLQLCKKNKRIVFNFIDDLGPVCKLIGGYQFMKKRRLFYDKLIIIDDDTLYQKELFHNLLNDKNPLNITTGSGFNFDNNFNYQIVTGKTEMVEGYAGICFNFDQIDKFILWYVGFYKHFNFASDNLIDNYLKASFLGDDFIISNCYDDKIAINNGRKYLKPYSYGFDEDALHKNNHFGSNMGSYKFLFDNIKILNTFKFKYELNKTICELECRN